MTSRISTRSKRQAMDWSLVLISQGIGSTIDHSEESGWGLIVGSEDHDSALRVIQQYRSENVNWSWRQKIRPDLLFDWGALAWVFLLCLFFALQRNEAVRSAGLMDSAAVSKGECWRLFTAIFLHGDPAHLAANAGIGLVLLGLTMGRYGTGAGLLAAYLSGAGGNVLTWILFKDHHSLGASGMVMGCVGLLAVSALPYARRNPAGGKYLLGGIVAGGMLFVLLGLNPGSDVLAHLGGFLSGLVLGAMMMLTTKPNRNAFNIIAGSTFCLLVIVTWWLALR